MCDEEEKTKKTWKRSIFHVFFKQNIFNCSVNACASGRKIWLAHQENIWMDLVRKPVAREQQFQWIKNRNSDRKQTPKKHIPHGGILPNLEYLFALQLSEMFVWWFSFIPKQSTIYSVCCMRLCSCLKMKARERERQRHTQISNEKKMNE